jgi:hypothetical protein
MVMMPPSAVTKALFQKRPRGRWYPCEIQAQIPGGYRVVSAGKVYNVESIREKGKK